MTAGHALFPVIGGLALIAGGLTAGLVDRLEVIAEGGPSPVWQRYTSLATADLRKKPHWIFLASATVFAVCLIVTTMWQAQLAAAENDDDPSLANRLRWFGITSALGAYLVALLPVGNAVGTVVHLFTAAIFVSMGFNYVFITWQFADDRGDRALATIRLAFMLLGLVGVVCIFFLTYPAVVGTSKLQAHTNAVKHNTEEGRLQEKEIFVARLFEFLLALAQDSLAISIGVVLITGAVEVTDIDQSSAEATVAGVVAFAGMLLLNGIFYYTNSQWFQMCQVKKEDTVNAQLKSNIEEDSQ
jgi:hypothetical protein